MATPVSNNYETRTAKKAAWSGAFFYGFFVAIIPGIPISIWGISQLADHVDDLVAMSVVTVSIVGALVLILYVSRRRLAAWLKLGGPASIKEVVEPLNEAASATRDRDLDKAIEKLQLASIRFASWYSWVSVRGWAFRLLLGVFATFVALIGSALLSEQNREIKTQTAKIEEQNEFLRQQILQEAVQDYRTRRAQLLATLYDEKPCPEVLSAFSTIVRSHRCFVGGPRARAEAMIAFVAIEREAISREISEQTPSWLASGPSRRLPRKDEINLSNLNLQASLANWEKSAPLGDTLVARLFKLHTSQGKDDFVWSSLPRRTDLSYVTLTRSRLAGLHAFDVNFSHAWMESVDLRGADLSKSTFKSAKLARVDLRGAHLYQADFTDAHLRMALLKEVDLMSVVFENARMDQADLSYTKGGAMFRNAWLRGVTFVGADLRGANFEGARLTADPTAQNARGTNFSKANLTGANFSGALLKGAKFDGAYFFSGSPPRGLPDWKERGIEERLAP